MFQTPRGDVLFPPIATWAHERAAAASGRRGEHLGAAMRRGARCGIEFALCSF